MPRKEWQSAATGIRRGLFAFEPWHVVFHCALFQIQGLGWALRKSITSWLTHCSGIWPSELCQYWKACSLLSGE